MAEERKVLSEVLEHLREVDRRRLYADYGHSSLWDFCIAELGYSEGCASRRIAAMRLLRELPELKQELIAGQHTLSSLAQAQKFFRAEKKHGAALSVARKQAVLSQIAGKSARECERELSRLSSVPEERVETKVAISERLAEKLRRLQALRSHAQPGANYSEVIEFLADEMLKKLDPERKPAATPAPPTPAVSRRSRLHIPTATRRHVWQRDRGKCTACGTRYFLELDHVVPVALGGVHSAANLRLRCRAHNQRAAIPKFDARVGRFANNIGE